MTPAQERKCVSSGRVHCWRCEQTQPGDWPSSSNEKLEKREALLPGEKAKAYWWVQLPADVLSLKPGALAELDNKSKKAPYGCSYAEALPGFTSIAKPESRHLPAWSFQVRGKGADPSEQGATGCATSWVNPPP